MDKQTERITERIRQRDGWTEKWMSRKFYEFGDKQIERKGWTERKNGWLDKENPRNK